MDTKQLSRDAYAQDVQRLARENRDFRRVVNTTAHTQLVLMSLPPGGEIGEEIHPDTDQVLAVVEGAGHAVLGNRRSEVHAGTVVVVPAGVNHNVLADKSDALKLFTIYAPPHHRPGTVHATKAEANADTGDRY